MGLIQKVLVDCSQPHGQQTTVAPLSADEAAAYTAQQPIGQAQAAADAVRVILMTQHTTALGQLKSTLTGNATTTGNDITAVEGFITALENGTAPTGAQIVQTLRFILRALAVLNS